MIIHSALIQCPGRQHPEDVGHLSYPDAQLFAEVFVDALILLLVCQILLGTCAWPHGCHHPTLEILRVRERLAHDGISEGKMLPKGAMRAHCWYQMAYASRPGHAAVLQSLASPHHKGKQKCWARPCKHACYDKVKIVNT